MKKLSLLFVLSVVSVFSVSAQINYQPTAGVNPPEIARVALQPNGTVSTPEPKLRVIGQLGKSDSLGIPIKSYTLGSLSTGNLTVDGYIEEFCALYDIDPLLIYAQMNQESGFRARATSHKGASGFMQLMPDTARRFGVTNIYNPQQNIKAGIKYMRWLLDKFDGDVTLALAGYNAGEGAVMKYGNKIPPYRETQNYVVKIMNHYETISNQDSLVAQSN